MQDKNGLYKIGGLCGGHGAKPVKCWMKIPFPHEDFTGWHSEYAEGSELPRKEKHQYLVCVEKREYGRTTYELRIARYAPSSRGDWIGFEFKDRTRDVIAWRELPTPEVTK